MKSKSVRTLLIFSILNALALLAFFLYYVGTKPKTGYVDLARVFAEFDMAKEKQQEFESLNMGYKNTLDSLALELDYLESQEAKAPSAELENRIAQKKAVYYQLDEKMQQKLGEFKAEADGQVWAQINSLTSEYGKSKGYEFIYGGNGTGSLMYAKETKDITQEVLNYINKKYAGE